MDLQWWQAITPLCGRIACTSLSVRPSVLVPRPWRDIAILACPSPPELFIPTRSWSALAAFRPCLPPDCRPPVRPSIHPCKPRAWCGHHNGAHTGLLGSLRIIVNHCCIVCCKKSITASQYHCCSGLQWCRLVIVTLCCSVPREKSPPPVQCGLSHIFFDYLLVTVTSRMLTESGLFIKWLHVKRWITNVFAVFLQ